MRWDFRTGKVFRAIILGLLFSLSVFGLPFHRGMSPDDSWASVIRSYFVHLMVVIVI